MHQVGIGTTHRMSSVVTGLFLPSWRFRGYTIQEKINLWRGRSFSKSLGLWDQFIRVDLRTAVPRLDVPVYFFEGKYDYTCNIDLAREYLQKIDAPVKGFYEFDKSAHSPLFEQSADTHEILRNDELTGSATLATVR